MWMSVSNRDGTRRNLMPQKNGAGDDAHDDEFKGVLVAVAITIISFSASTARAGVFITEFYQIPVVRTI